MRIQLLGEGGGIGDTLQRLGVVRSIKAALPTAKVWMFVQNSLVEWAALGRVADMIAAVADQSHRAINQPPDPDKYPYLDIGAPFDVTVDLYDPAEAHENAAIGHVTQSRVELWRGVATAVLGCKLTPQLNRLFTAPQTAELAAIQLHARLGRQPSFLVGLQPLAYWRWRSICFDQVSGIVKALQHMGAQCVLFHHTADPVEAWAKELNAISVIGEKPAVLAEMVRLCDAMISIDSGFFHLAGMLGVPTVGIFAQTDGKVTGQEYKSCRWVTAGPPERADLLCRFPCYRRAAYGCNRPPCERGCRALYQISPKRVVDMTAKLILERKGVHLPPEERARRMFSKHYRV